MNTYDTTTVTAGGGGSVPPMRSRVLGRAQSLICGDRAKSYGDYGAQMASLANAFNSITGHTLGPNDVSTLLVLLKLRRMQTSTDPDSAVDLCGYAALHAEFFLDELEIP